jgi:hypothetical protein
LRGLPIVVCSFANYLKDQTQSLLPGLETRVHFTLA